MSSQSIDVMFATVVYTVTTIICWKLRRGMFYIIVEKERSVRGERERSRERDFEYVIVIV